MISKYDDFELPRVCENSSVNAILSYYFDCAKKSNITTKFQISIPSNINIDSIDLNVIFGNCLENAIDACLKLTGEKQKYLNIKAAIVNNYFVIDMSNSFNGFIDAQEDIFFSTKSDAANHGIGLESVKNLVSQYSGTISLAYSENEFRTSIMMHNGPSS